MRLSGVRSRRTVPGHVTSLRLTLSASLLLFTSPMASRAAATYPDTEAAKHVGEKVTVTGKVATVSKSAKGTTFLNFGDRFPKHTFTGVVFARDEEKVGDLKPFEGKTVALTGKIELSPTDQKPQIVITSAGQIKLSEPGSTPPPPSTPAPPPATTPPPPPATTSAPQPVTPMPVIRTPTLPPTQPAIPAKPAEEKKIALAANWNSAPQGGDMTRKDLALLFGSISAKSGGSESDPAAALYLDIPYLTPLAMAKKRLSIENTPSTKSKVTCPGLPVGSLSANTFNGIFAGGFSQLTLVTDLADQVVSILLVDENTRQRTPEVTDNSGYHTYNFVSHRVKGTGGLVIKHQIATDSAPGVVVVETMLIDPNAPDTTPKPRTSTRTSSSSKTSTSHPRTGKVLERSKWFVPMPVVNLILRCIGNG